MSDISQAKKHLATIADYKKVFNSDSGKRVLWDLMRKSNMTGSILGSHDGKICLNQTLLNEGERNLVLYILSKLKFNERVLMDMIEENKKRGQI